MSILATMSAYSTDQLYFRRDIGSGLQCIVALNTRRGIHALGGIKICQAIEETDAIEEALRIADRIAKATALAHLPLGGGGAILITDPETMQSESAAGTRTALLTSFGHIIQGFGGQYLAIEGEDIDSRDIELLQTITPFAIGSPLGRGSEGETSTLIALGVRCGIDAISQCILGRTNLHGVHIAIQGLGPIGTALAIDLHSAGARLTISDPDPRRASEVAAYTGAQIVAPANILTVPCDILSPCGESATITEAIATSIRTRAIAGSAINPLSSTSVHKTLQERKIFYAPDFAIGAGGLIGAAAAYARDDRHYARQQVMAIHQTISNIIMRSRRDAIPPEIAAERMIAGERIIDNIAPRIRIAA